MDSQFQIGAQAIQPHLSSIPAFTEEDVRSYVATHHLPGGSISSVTAPTVIAIKLMTTQAASELIHSFISWHEDDLVCYVELEGAFTFHGGPPGYVSRYATTPAETRACMILDARTGNCLVTGFLPARPDR